MTSSQTRIISDKKNNKENMRTEFITKALKIGSIALQDIAVVEKTDYIKREFQKLCDELDRVLLQLTGRQIRQRVYRTKNTKSY